MAGPEYVNLKNAICLTDLKAAALYFDRVVPINPVELIDYDLPPITETYTQHHYIQDLDRVVRSAVFDNRDLIEALVFKDADVSDTFKRSALEEIVSKTEQMYEPLKEAHPSAFYNAQYILPVYHQYQQLAASQLLVEGSVTTEEKVASKLIAELCSKLGVKNPSLLLALSPSVQNEDANAAVEVVLSQLKMIDTSKVSFEQILQIRSDVDSQNRLKRLRLFIHENFSELDPEIAADKFEQTLYDYHEACRKHGLNTVDSTLTGILSFETFIASTAGIISGSVVLGSTVASLATGLTFALGGAALNIVKTSRVSRSYAKDHAVSYLFHDLGNIRK